MGCDNDKRFCAAGLNCCNGNCVSYGCPDLNTFSLFISKKTLLCMGQLDEVTMILCADLPPKWKIHEGNLILTDFSGYCVGADLTAGPYNCDGKWSQVGDLIHYDKQILLDDDNGKLALIDAELVPNNTEIGFFDHRVTSVGDQCSSENDPCPDTGLNCCSGICIKHSCPSSDTVFNRIQNVKHGLCLDNYRLLIAFDCEDEDYQRFALVNGNLMSKDSPMCIGSDFNGKLFGCNGKWSLVADNLLYDGRALQVNEYGKISFAIPGSDLSDDSVRWNLVS
jgi:hypothetical protein